MNGAAFQKPTWSPHDRPAGTDDLYKRFSAVSSRLTPLDAVSVPASPRKVAGRAAARLGHPGSSSSVMSDGTEFAHQESRQRRYALRVKGRSYARRDTVERTRWVSAFGVASDRRRHDSYGTGEGMQGDQVRTWTDWREESYTAPRDDKYIACGMRRRDGGSHVGIRMTEGGRAGYANLQTCGSVWSCPVCAGKIMRQRADDLGGVLAWARREGHTVAMVTLTVRHKREDALTGVWDAVSHSWGKVTSGSAWVSEKPEVFRERVDRWDEQLEAARAGRGRFPRGGRTGQRPQRRIGDQERYGVLGWARAAEVKHSRNGWHVHLHVVVVLERQAEGAEGKYLGEQTAYQLGHAMFGRWNASLPAKHRASEKHGYDVSVHGQAEKRLAEYLAKDGLDDDAGAVTRSIDAAGRSVAMEATHGASKTHMKNTWSGSTPFQILDRLDPGVQTDGAFKRDLAIWYEWVDGSEGRRQLTWSKGLRELAGMAEEQMSDEEVAAQEDGGDVVLTLPIATWTWVRHESWELLDMLERDGLAVLRAYLDTYEWFDDKTGEFHTGLEYGVPGESEDDLALWEWKR